jgi:hypothetical protein
MLRRQREQGLGQEQIQVQDGVVGEVEGHGQGHGYRGQSEWRKRAREEGEEGECEEKREKK